MIRILKILIFVILAIESSFAQFSAINIKELIGTTIKIPVIYNDSLSQNKLIHFQSDLFIKNPTVFYPEKIVQSKDYTLQNDSLIRLTDSTYHLKFDLILESEFIVGDTLFYIQGELLAGSSTITQLSFTKVKLDDSLMEDFSSQVENYSSAGIITYHRFPHIFEYYPNPVNVGDKSTWVYYIDKDSDIKIWLCDLRWKQILLEEKKNVEKGIHVFEYFPTIEISMGLYWLMIETNLGYMTEPIFIIK